MRKSSSGFTIVELLIVVVVIAILAAISIVAFSGIQTRARASALASEIKAAEKAFNSYKVVSGAGNWWAESDTGLTGGGGITIAGIIANNAEFRQFLQKAPTKDGLDATGSWSYDQDNDTYDGCSINSTGVNIFVTGATNTTVMQALDNAIDDGNLSCGKLRYRSADTTLLYGLARQADQ